MQAPRNDLYGSCPHPVFPLVILECGWCCSKGPEFQFTLNLTKLPIWDKFYSLQQSPEQQVPRSLQSQNNSLPSIETSIQHLGLTLYADICRYTHSTKIKSSGFLGSQAITYPYDPLPPGGLPIQSRLCW